MESENHGTKQQDTADRRKASSRRIIDDRRTSIERRSKKDRRSDWGNIEEHMLRGAMAATASIVFQFSRPFTIIHGYVDLLLARTSEENSKKKLVIIKEQLQIISEILERFREVEEFKTKDFDGVEILDTDQVLDDAKTNKLDRKVL